MNGNGSKKVLVIDDTQEIRMIIAESLNLYGFTTLAAEDGISGVQIAKEQFPDLIICDINMPKLDGYGTLQGYGKLEIGSQGCAQGNYWEERQEYARRYNQTMWAHVSKQH